MAIDMSQLLNYQSGIYTGKCSTALNNALSVVGFGSENGTLFWILRNQWGTKWGEGGYLRLQRDTGKGPGKCGINLSASYPVV